MKLLSLVVIVIGVELVRERGRGAGAEALAPKAAIDRSDWLPLAFCKVDNIFSEADLYNSREHNKIADSNAVASCGGANTAPRSLHACQIKVGVCVCTLKKILFYSSINVIRRHQCNSSPPR